MDGTWEARIVDRLARLLDGGPKDERFFNACFAEALKDCPPRGRDSGVPRLFDEEGHREVSHVEATREYCRVAWFGEQPTLARFNADLLVGLDLIGQEAEDQVAA